MGVNPFRENKTRTPTSYHMPFVFEDDGVLRLVFSSKNTAKYTRWSLYHAALDGDLVDRTSIRHINTGLSECNHCGASAHRRDDGKLVLTFIAGTMEPETRYRAYQMVGSGLEELDVPLQVSSLHLRPWTICENRKYRVVSGKDQIHVCEMASQKLWALETDFTWIYRVLTDPLNDDRLIICGQVEDEHMSVYTYVYDLSSRMLQGVLTVEGKSVYKPSIYGNRVYYAVREGEEGDFDDRHIECSDDFEIVPIGQIGTITRSVSRVLVAENGRSFDVGGYSKAVEGEPKKRACHWKMLDKWYCVKLSKDISEDTDCRLCPHYDALDREILPKEERHAIENEERVALAIQENLVSPVGSDDIPEGILDNPFFGSRMCQSGLFCLTCRNSGQKGKAFRSMLVWRYGLPDEFPCPFQKREMECRFRGRVLRTAERRCCGGRRKQVEIYECQKGIKGGAVALDDCMYCQWRDVVTLKQPTSHQFIEVRRGGKNANDIL